MDAYTHYGRWRESGGSGSTSVGLGNRRLAAMLGDFLYETSSAEDESRRVLEWLYEPGMKVLAARNDRKDLQRFTSEHNRDERRANGEKEEHLSWHRIDSLSQQIVETLSAAAERSDAVFVENLSALDRMFSTTKALREFRNYIDHRAPSDEGGPLHFYRDVSSPVTVYVIWGWIEVAASYWTNLTHIRDAISMATTIDILIRTKPRSLQWPPPGMSIHGLRVLQQAGIPIPPQQLRDARGERTP